MSLMIIYFGFRADRRKLDLPHHNIILGPRYQELLRDIFDLFRSMAHSIAYRSQPCNKRKVFRTEALCWREPCVK